MQQRHRRASFAPIANNTAKVNLAKILNKTFANVASNICFHDNKNKPTDKKQFNGTNEE